MSLENQPQPNKEIIQNPKIEDIHTVEELRQYFTFADPVIGVHWGEGGVLEEYTPEYISAHPEITQVFVARHEDQIIAGAKIKMLDDAEKIRLGLKHENFENQIGALLEYTAVKEEHRNNGLLADLTNKRVDWAKEHGATFVCSEAEITNPISVYTKLRDGFVLVSVQEPCEGVVDPIFVEAMHLNSEEGKNETSNTPTPEWKEVTVTEKSFDELKKLFSEGWVGVDIKGINEASEKLSVPYTLIMERKR